MKQKTSHIPIVLFFLFLVLCIVGINMNEPSVVWEKAVKICFSCIGIG